jgi:hypothetical protein
MVASTCKIYNVKTTHNSRHTYFIDDLLMVCDRRQGNVECLQELNQVDPNIRLTFVISETPNTCLDLELMKKERFAADGKLDWKVYFKRQTPTSCYIKLHAILPTPSREASRLKLLGTKAYVARQQTSTQHVKCCSKSWLREATLNQKTESIS